MAQFSRKTTEIDAILDDVEAAVQGHESLENAINTLYAGMNAARTKMVIKGEVDYYNDLTQLDSPMIGDTYTVKYKVIPVPWHTEGNLHLSISTA